jgi:hypothetical protein
MTGTILTTRWKERFPSASRSSFWSGRALGRRSCVVGKWTDKAAKETLQYLESAFNFVVFCTLRAALWLN